MALYEGCVFSPGIFESTAIENEMEAIVEERIDLGKLAANIGEMRSNDFGKETLIKIDEADQYLTNLVHSIMNKNGRPAYPAAKFIQTGSQSYNMATDQSDLDLTLILQDGDEKESREAKIKVLDDIYHEICTRKEKGDGFISTAIPRAIKHKRGEDVRKRKPPSILILKTASGLSIDICVEEMDGLIMTALMKIAKAKAAPILQPLLQTLKYVGKICGVMDTRNQFPSSTVLFCLVIHYFQKRTPQVFKAVNMRAITFDDKDLSRKFIQKGEFKRLGEVFMTQAIAAKSSPGAILAAQRSMMEDALVPNKVLPTAITELIGPGHPDLSAILKTELINVCQFLGNPWNIPAVIDLAHPADDHPQPDIYDWEPCVRVVCPYALNREYFGDGLQTFCAAYKYFGLKLKKSPTLIPLVVKPKGPGVKQRRKMQERFEGGEASGQNEEN